MRTAIQLLKHRPDGDRDLAETHNEEEKAALWRRKESLVKWALISICMGGAIAYGTSSVLLICIVTSIAMVCGRVHEWIPSEKTARLNRARARRFNKSGDLALFLRYDPVNILQSSSPILHSVSFCTVLLMFSIVIFYGDKALFPALGMFCAGMLATLVFNNIADRAERIGRTDLLLNKDGLNFDWTRDWRHPTILTISWNQIEAVSFIKEKSFGLERSVLQLRISISEWTAECEKAILKSPANFFIEYANGEKLLFINLRSDGFICASNRKDLIDFLTAQLPSEKIVGANTTVTDKTDVSYTDLWLDSLTSSTPRLRSTDLQTNTKVGAGRYTIVEQLGAGGQGVAYTATDHDTNTAVVLKEFVLPAAAKLATRKRALENVQKEAMLLAQLNHAQIVKYIDFFVEDHRAYLVLEHIDGLNLRRYVQEKGPLDPDLVVQLSIQMCDILEYLHSFSPAVVHRDFTPDNLMFANFEIVKLLDFNVAQQLEMAGSRTVVGKHSYLPPEQFRGKATSQSDIYSLGATMFFLLTGVDPEPISSSHPGLILAELNQELDAVVAKATATKESERYLDSQALKADLIRLKMNHPVVHAH